MVEAFEIMNGAYPKNNGFDSVYKDGWDSKAKEDATSYLNAITKFEFLIGLVSRKIYKGDLSTSSKPTTKLRVVSRTCNI